MANNIKKIARRLGAKVVRHVPHTGGGAFGAARLAQIVKTASQKAETVAGGYEPCVPANNA
jgi:hypothetical protein